MSTNYSWKFCSLGGASRVRISCGEDIAHLGELDQKLWTALSCPVDGLEFNKEFLEIMDSDKDKRIRVKEVVKASEWVCDILKDRDLLLKSQEELPLSAINSESPEGARILKSVKQILSNLGKAEADHISLSDTIDSTAIFAKTLFNGDGIITEASAAEDEAARRAIAECLACIPAKTDRSGAPGIDSAAVESFYADLAAYKAWRSALQKENLPYGKDTQLALDAIKAVDAAVEEYFSRCEYFRYDPACEQAQDHIELISHPCAEGLLFLDKINPKWIAAFAKVRSLILDKDLPEAASLSKEQWRSIKAKFAAYEAWLAAKVGCGVEKIGLEEIEKLLEEDKKACLLELIQKDLELKSESESIDDVHKFLVLYRHLYKFLNNFVIFGEFYDRSQKSVFDAGELYIDQRCLKLCVRVADMGKQTTMAPQSGMYIIYCDCVSQKTGKKLNIAAILTNGDTDNLSVGMNAVFYDRDGLDYDATVTKIIDNPTSIRQAFLHPYKKFAKAISDKINKNAAEKENKVNSDLTAMANNFDPKAAAAAPKKGFDPTTMLALSAGVGVGAGVILNAISALVKPWYTLLLVIAGLCLIISGPSMFLAWLKLKKRNLGPILNANGWAINSTVLVTPLFGATLTSLAKYPKVISKNDPFAIKKKSPLPFILLLLVVIAAGVVLALLKKGIITF